MASKLKVITDLYEDTINQISNDPSEWMSFLECAAMNYKYSFNDQVLIYAQKPQAVACARIEDWNKKVGRWVNRGAKGIALLSENSGYNTLRYVFDVADTNSKNGKSFRLWSVSKSYELDIIELLESKYGELNDKSSLELVIKEVSKIIVEDNFQDYLDDLISYTHDSSLNSLSYEEVEATLRNILESSVAFSIMKRCGIDPNQYFTKEDFYDISKFNSYDTITRLGIASSEISEMGIREIYSNVKNLRINEINKIRTFELNDNLRYDLDESRKTANRRDENESNLHNTGGLQDTRFNTTREQNTSRGQIRTDEIKVFEREQESPIYNIINEESASTTFNENPSNSREQSRTDSIRNENKREDNRRNEDERSNGVGRTNEQLENISRGNSNERINLQLETYNNEKNTPYVVVDEKVNQILSITPHLKKSNNEIKEFFNNEKDLSKRAKFLKDIFNSDYTNVVVDDETYSYKIYNNGILFWKNDFETRDTESFIEWEKLTYHYEAMILLNQLNDRVEPIPSVQDQLSFIEENSEDNISNDVLDLEFTQEFVDEYLTELHREEKYLIYREFQKNLSTKDNEDFLKEIYGIGGSTHIVRGSGIGEEHDSKGIRFNRGYFGKSAREKRFTWNYISKRISTLIKEDRFLNPKEIEDYPKWLEKEQQEDINILTEEKEESLAKRLNDFIKEYDLEGYRANLENEETEEDVIQDIDNQIHNTSELRGFIEYLQNLKDDLDDSDDEKNIINNFIIELKETFPDYDYQIGDKVYIGAEEFEILSLENNIVRLYDYNAPLFEKEMSFEEFDRKVKENPSNDHLKVKIVNTKEKKEQFNAEEFEKKLPNNMRFKESSVVNNNLYWITQKIFNESDINKFQKALKDTAFDKAYITVRDLSNYVFEDDLEKKVFAIVTKDSINYTDYVTSIKEVFGSDYFTKKEEIREPNEYSEFNDKEDLIGKNITIGDREFTIDSITNDKVSLEDITFQNGVGFPIFREMDLEEVLSIVSKTEKEKDDIIAPKLIKKSRNRVTTFDPHPEISNDNRSQFRILNDELGEGTPKEKFNHNIEAIKVLKKCEKEDRFATPEEQEILSKYVGWGGLPQAFDNTDSSWSNEYNILINLLDTDEYEQARESTLTAYYTPPIVIKSIYKALENMGLKTGNILEPSCGTGNFIGMLPDSLKDCKLYGIEIDSISGRIARQLYQKSSIAIQGYENTNLPNSFFDVAVGNVPFGNFKVLDKKYDKNNFLIHDYFFAKTLDKVRPGGVIAFITYKGTMDKDNPSVRKYIAQRADLLGAIRLPNDTFKKNAGTEVTADIIFLQKRESITDIEPYWIYNTLDENNVKMNDYFVRHPEMIMGNMKEISTRFGKDFACISDGENLESKLEQAINNIHAEVKEYDLDDMGEEDNSIEADLNVRNFSYTLVDGQIYFRENSRMYPQEFAKTTENRVKGLIELRDCVRNLIELQTEDYPEEDIKDEQIKLNRLYDSFTKKYGLINSRGNKIAFSDDSSYYLLCSLEILDDKGNLLKKADMFSKRTIKPKTEITNVDNAHDALLVSIAEKARVDLEYIQKLCGLDMDQIISDLKGEIFNVPEFGDPNHWVTVDEYLSGNVREKLEQAEFFATDDERFKINVEYLKKVQPKDLDASEISVRLGATWIPEEDIKDFIIELLNPNYFVSKKIKVHYMPATSQWQIDGKSLDKSNVKAHNTYGTHRVNAYKIIEDSLNLRDTRVYDYIVDESGKKVAELNKKETAIAQSKQEIIKNEFANWIWKDPIRREKLVRFYNEDFNCIRPREYDGSHIVFDGMNPEIKLREHQVNAIARILYGGNTLLAHEVGAGKTFEMVAAAMEAKRLGLCNKSLFVVPNHIVEQFGQEFLRLYPSANILVTTKKDFQTANRKKFCSRIATGDYDAVIISHSQFEKIPMSIERQVAMIENQINDIVKGIEDLKNENAERYSIKQMEKMKRQLENKLKKLYDTSRKDDVITFEELGVDRLFIDEAHYFKNLYLYTKMRNVGGIAQTEAKKSSDLFMKCRYLDELTGGKGVVFATGTPVSNSMVELYTMQRYLQYGELEKRNLQQFDAWASTFGETTTAIELSPEGTGYRAKTRFAKFFNLPELMAMFKEVADIQTSDMLDLPVPKANYENIVVKPTEIQKEMVKELAERAEKIRNRQVKADVDNMLKITNDGRKLALDQRNINGMLPDDSKNKVSICANNVYKIWKETEDKKLTQLVFCDLSTPHNDGEFNVYDDLKVKLIERGIPEEEIQFIHNANTDAKKQELFSKVRNGQVRVLMGSTQKMGAGTNCQDRLIALHDLDCPWRPSDLIQRSGRIIRQGNRNKEVYIFRYVTEGTFDAYLYQLVENKQKFISQIMTSKTPVRYAEDIDETALSYAEIKALAAGNPDIIEKTELDTQVAKLKLLKQNYLSQKYTLEDKIIKFYPNEIKGLENKIERIVKDLETLDNNTTQDNSFEKMIINGETIIEKKKAGEKIIELCKSMTSSNPIEIGEYKGFKMFISFDTFGKDFNMELKNNLSYKLELGDDPIGNITRIDNGLKGIENKLKSTKEKLSNLKIQYENAKEEIKKPFEQEEELKEKTKRLNKINIKLNLDKKEKVIVDDDIDEESNSQVCKKEYSR